MELYDTQGRLITYPGVHASQHQDGGNDELSIEGLAGSPVQKAAASGLASLNGSTKVVQQPASISDFLDNTPGGTDGLLTKAPTSNALFDGIRVKLTAARTYYVRADGNNANTGLVNNAGGAFLTIQAAVDAVALLDIAANIVTIQIADGTYSASVILKNVMGFAALGNLVIQGNAATPANVIVDAVSQAISADGLSAAWDIKDLKIVTPAGAANHGLYVKNGSPLRFGNLNFGSCGGAHIRAETGGSITVLSAYAITGGAAYHMMAAFGGQLIVNSVTITSTGTFAFTAFAYSIILGFMHCNANTYTGGTITGKRYQADTNGVINTSGGGANYFPGDAAGTTDGFGVYA